MGTPRDEGGDTPWGGTGGVAGTLHGSPTCPLCPPQPPWPRRRAPTSRWPTWRARGATTTSARWPWAAGPWDPPLPGTGTPRDPPGTPVWGVLPHPGSPTLGVFPSPLPKTTPSLGVWRFSPAPQKPLGTPNLGGLAPTQPPPHFGVFPPSPRCSLTPRDPPKPPNPLGFGGSPLHPTITRDPHGPPFNPWLLSWGWAGTPGHPWVTLPSPEVTAVSPQRPEAPQGAGRGGPGGSRG